MHDLIRLYAREHADLDAELLHRASRLRLFAWYVHSVDAACRRLEPYRPHRDRPTYTGSVRPVPTPPAGSATGKPRC